MKSLYSAFCVLALLNPLHGLATDQWPGVNKGYDGQRYSPLKQITAANVASLKPICTIEAGELGSFQSGILVVGKTLYVTTPHSTIALDAADCKLIWRHSSPAQDREIHPSNRGPAYDRGRLFRGTPDGRLLAIDASSGKEIWAANLRDGHPGEFVSAAPIVWNGRLLVGTSGGDWGTYTRVLAFDTASGKELWHFNLTPKNGEYGAETWGGVPEEKRKGASSWSSYALDPKSGELFVTTGNPVPAMDASVRPGDNLFTNSLVVLDAKTGKLNWHYQVLPNDDHDWDLAAPPMLYRSGNRNMVALSSKDGHLYGIDRSTHALAFKTPVTTVLNQDVKLTVEGVRACPGVYGGTLWNGPAFDPRKQTIYVGTADRCMLFKIREPDSTSLQAVGFGTAAVISETTDDVSQGWVNAVDAATGKPIWKFHNDAPVISAVTPTAGGLVFAGDVFGKFFALDARTGKEIYKLDTGSMLSGGVVSYQVGKRQYVAFVNGGMARAVYSIKTGIPKITIATLAPKGFMPTVVKYETTDKTEESSEHAIKLYAQLCALCHGDQGMGIDGPRLRGVAVRKDQRPVAEIIRKPSSRMPAFYPGVLNDKEVDALANFIEGWK